ncbi:hypothetical protein BDP27DRAFT_1315319, partial [Rhodocollybia butyracea]
MKGKILFLALFTTLVLAQDSSSSLLTSSIIPISSSLPVPTSSVIPIPSSSTLPSSSLPTITATNTTVFESTTTFSVLTIDGTATTIPVNVTSLGPLPGSESSSTASPSPSGNSA